MKTLRGNESPHIGTDHQRGTGHLAAILRNMSTRITADIICIYTYDYTSERLTAIDLLAQDGVAIMSQDVLSQWIQSQVDILCSEAQHMAKVLALEEHDCGTVRSAIVWPIAIYRDLLGIVALLSYQPDHFSDDDIGPLAVWVEMARMILENGHLRTKLATAEATTIAARAIARHPSPQNIIHILRDHLFSSCVSSCLVTLFGPTPPDNPHGPYEYLEVRASWSRKMGSSVGIGHRFNIADHQETLERLQVEPFVTITDMDYVEAQVGDFDKAMLASDH